MIFYLITTILIAICYYFFKCNDSKLVLISTLLLSIFNFINIQNENYFLMKYFVEIYVIFLGIIFKVRPSILIIFLISIIYNLLSYVEFTTQYSYIYDSYASVMILLQFSLLFIIFKNGYKNGISNIDHDNNNNDHSGYSRFFRRSL